MIGKNEQASSAKFFSGTTRWATEGSPQRDKPTGRGGGAAAGRSPAARARRARGRAAEAARSGSAVAGRLRKAVEQKELPR